ncbi:MAG: hypothetical protein HZC42_12670 [Candidatus Eisenbacteria bacterium]|nr:hypothetical protein [Candidatus Eisenbacteria bacterium]
MTRVLIFALESHWVGIPRLPKALREAGFEVAALCPRSSYLSLTRFLDQRFDLESTRPGMALLGELARTLADWEPRLVVPGDDATVAFLHRVCERWLDGRLREALPEPAARVLLASLGDPERHDETLNKSASQRAAAELGVPVPPQTAVRDVASALDFALRVGWPVVLKRPFGTGGAGLTLCHDEPGLMRAVEEALVRGAAHHPLVGAIPDLARAPRQVKRYVRHLLEDPQALAAPQPQDGVSLQRFLDGTPAMYALAALEGRILAGFAALKVRVHPPVTGPSSVVRFFDHVGMAATAAALIRRFRFNGFASLDFVIEPGSDRAVFLECNARPSPVSHLGALAGPDLCRALHDGLEGREPAPSPPVREQTVALYPQEMRRDPQSPFLRECLHDVPEDDPELLEAFRRQGEQGNPPPRDGR